MGTYTGSPWGHIRGKVDDAVGGVWKGIEWVRVRVFPTQPGTITRYRLWKDDPTTPFSFKQFNIRRLVTQVLGYIARFGSNLTVWIRPVWEALCDKRGWTMTGANAFIRRNAAILFASMENPAAEYKPTMPAINAPDLTKMLVSDGDLEPAAVLETAVYNPETGALGLHWSSATFTNGSPDDIVNVIVAKKPLLEMEDEPDMTLWNWAPKLFIYPFLPAPPAPAVPATRADEGVEVMLPTGLDAANLTAYLFFRDAEGHIGYSPSVGSQVLPPAP